MVDEKTVGTWLAKTGIFKRYLRSLPHLRESNISFELWTTGTFTPEALARLSVERTKRARFPIAWKDGAAVVQLARKGKEKAIAAAFEEHFMKHPLSSQECRPQIRERPGRPRHSFQSGRKRTRVQQVDAARPNESSSASISRPNARQRRQTTMTCTSLG